MNIASWLARAGLSHPEMPAAARGTRVVASYRQLAARAARLAGALRTRLKLAPGDRVAIVAKNSPAYLELVYGIWHAGLAAVPATEFACARANVGSRNACMTSTLST